LNSQFYENPSDVQIAAEEQDKWLDAQLMSITEKKVKYVIIFQHIPWFLRDVDEDKEYSNLPLGLRKTYLEKFQTAGVLISHLLLHHVPFKKYFSFYVLQV
jgi:serine/threonine-protein phosphatase CPPED1